MIDYPYGQEEDITGPYDVLKERQVPIFITSDSLLHLYHIQFDETLRQIEEKEFYDDIWNISKALLRKAEEDYRSSSGDVKEAAKRNVAFFSVALSLLQPKENQTCPYKGEEAYWRCGDQYFSEDEVKNHTFTVPDYVKEKVLGELKLISEHQGFSESLIFKYCEDYSQYVPRGHYTRSEKLKNYFKAMMWYGRMSFLLNGGEPAGCMEPWPVDPENATIQTAGATLIAKDLSSDEDAMNKWDRIYSVTAFYVGYSDDLGPYEYVEAMNKVFGGSLSLSDITPEKIEEMKNELNQCRTPAIYGGTGNVGLSPEATEEDLKKLLEKTKGFRLMGQRFIPDSYMFQNLVWPAVDGYNGNERPFTLVISPAAGPIRGFPRGLDVMGILGSKRAKELLGELDDSNYVNYTVQHEKLKNEFDSLNESQWQKNLYWAWLYSLKPLLKEYGDGYPTFMQTKAWQDKELTTALASWTELRHDTILYAKQSYTPIAMSMPPPKPKNVVGYVEPVPEFYARLLALTRMTNKGLDERGVLDENSKSRLKNLETVLEKLENISDKELNNEELTEEDYNFINNFGKELNGVISDVDEKAKKTTIVADVHTDTNSGNVLEEGVGYVKLIVVAYKVPDGRVLMGAGPAFSYYEFKHPMEERLTDEKWRDLLKTSPPGEPEWTENFTG